VVVGGGIGATLAKKVEMTKMPELVAAMHSLIGLAAVCIAVAAVSEPCTPSASPRNRRAAAVR
jgi:NAD(P) transhydrogenase subunit beta